MVGERIQISGQAAVLNNANHVEFRPQRIQRTGEADPGVLHLDGGLVQVRPIPQCFVEQVLHGFRQFLIRHRHRVNHGDVSTHEWSDWPDLFW